MRLLCTTLSVLVGLSLVADVADARRKRHRHHWPAIIYVTPPAQSLPDTRERRSSSRSEPTGRRRAQSLQDAVPPGWTLQPPDTNWAGTRYLAPDGQSWFAIYRVAAGAPPAEHMKTVAFADGETIINIRGGRSWIAVAGFKGDRTFFRKAALLCGGTEWRHVAFEYPIELQSQIADYVDAASTALDRDERDCDVAVGQNAQ